MIGRVLIYSTGIIVLVILAWTIGPNTLRILSAVQPHWLVITIMSWSTAFLIRAARWMLLLTPAGKTVSFSSSFWSICIAYLVNFIVPTKLASEAARAAALSRKEEISFFTTLSSIAVEKTVDFLVMVGLATAALVLLPASNIVPDWIMQILRASALFAAILLVSMFLASWRLSSLVDKIRSNNHTFGVIGRTLAAMLSAFANGFSWVIRNPLPFLRSCGLTLMLWSIYSSGVYAIFQSLGTAPDPASILLGTLLFSFAHNLPNPPAYVGTYEGMWVLMFLALGVGSSQVLFAGAVIGHLISTAITISLGSIGLIKIGISPTEFFKITRNPVPSGLVQQ